MTALTSCTPPIYEENNEETTACDVSAAHPRGAVRRGVTRCRPSLSCNLPSSAPERRAASWRPLGLRRPCWMEGSPIRNKKTLQYAIKRIRQRAMECQADWRSYDIPAEGCGQRPMRVGLDVSCQEVGHEVGELVAGARSQLAQLRREPGEGLGRLLGGHLVHH